MKIIITEQQRKSLNEMIKLDIKVGDTLMGGKFKNKKVVVKTIGKNDKGDITINGKPLLRFRILKEDKTSPDNKILSVFKTWLYGRFDNISFLENSIYDGHPLIKIYYTTDSDAVNYDAWLASEIADEWNNITSGMMPVVPRWKFSGYNAKIVIDTEEFVDEDEEVINEGISIDKSVELFKKWLYNNYPNISFLEVTTKKDPYLNPSRFKDIPLVIVHYTESDEGEYPTWKPNYRSWLVMNIVETWNTITGGSIPVTGSDYDKIDHKNVKILVDAEEFSEDEEESINENVNDKKFELFGEYIKTVHPEFLDKNTIFRMSSSEDTLYLYKKGPDNTSRVLLYIDIDRYGDYVDKHMYFMNDKYVDMFNNVFGDNWAELFLHWVNNEYKDNLKKIFNELDWKITGVN